MDANRSVSRTKGSHSGHQRWNVHSSTGSFGITCVVCCQELPGKHRKAIIATGPCDHPICYHCATKIRVLFRQNECPICRQIMPEVIFTENLQKKYHDHDVKRKFHFNDEYRIYFETSGCLEAFNSLSGEICKKCLTPFDNVPELQDHLWAQHRLLTCELCVQNLSIFSEERTYYTAGQLEAHMKHGGPGDRSYQGHPVCQLCNQRCVDPEELNRHLHREHYYCHLCDPTKKVYYSKYETLHAHFAEEHYLCDQGPCKNEQFTSVFRTLIDLQAHKAQIHCLTKSEAKHARTLALDLTFNPSTRSQRAGGFNPQVVAVLNDDGFLPRSGSDRGRRGRGGGGGGDRNPPTIPEDAWMTEDLDILGAVGPAQQILRLEDFPSLGELSRQDPPTRLDPIPLSATLKSAADRDSTDNSNNPNSKAPKKPKHKFSTKVKESATFGRVLDDDFPALHHPNSNGDKPSTYNPVQPSTSISLADAVKLNPKAPPEKTTSQPINNGKPAKSTINSSNRMVNDLIDPNQPSSTQDFALAQNDFPSLPFKVNGNRKKKKSLNILLASLNNPQPNPPPNYTSMRLVDSPIPKENNGSTSNRNDNGSSLEKDMESLLLKEDNFPPLTGESSKSKSCKVNKKSTNQSINKLSGPSKSTGSSQSPDYERCNPNKKSSELSMKNIAEQVIKPKISTTSSNTTTSNKHQNGTNSRSIHNHSHHDNEQLTEYVYIYPKDFDERNRHLFDLIQSTLKDRFKDFDQISRAFFNDDIPPLQYYNKCVEMFRNKLNNVLLDLIVLLPDIRKQKHLMAAHETNLKQRTGSVPKRTGIWKIKTDSELDIVVCPMCGQVLCKKDGPDHITTHQKIKRV